MPDQIELAERVLWVLCLSAQTLDFLDILKKVLQKKIKKKSIQLGQHRAMPCQLSHFPYRTSSGAAAWLRNKDVRHISGEAE